MSGFEEFGIGSGDEGVANKSKRFKAKEGEKYRISFLWWPGMDTGKPDLNAPTPKFIGCKRLYLAGVGYFIDKGPEFVKIAGQASKMQIATIICKWPTDTNGALDKAAFQDKKFQVMPWVISADKYKNIEQNHSEFPLGQHDLTLSCTDTQYQKITISPCRENLFRKIYEAKDPAWAEVIIKATQEAITAIHGELAQDLTLEQVREKVSRNGGGGAGGGSGGGGGGGPGGGVAQNSKDFDNMLDDILG